MNIKREDSNNFSKDSLKEIKITNNKSGECEELLFHYGINKFLNSQSYPNGQTEIGRFEYWNPIDLSIVSDVYKKLSKQNDIITDVDIEKLTQ